MSENSTIVAIATPPGHSGVAVVRISGGGAIEVAGKVFRPVSKKRKLENLPGYSAAYGNFYNGEALLDDGVALVFRAPHSYTGEDVVELSCHGSGAVSRQLLNACLRAGAQPAPPGEYTRRAVINGRMSLTQAEAVMDLIAAETQVAAAAAKAAHSGALQRCATELKGRLVELAGHLAAWTDYPEEDVEELEEHRYNEVVSEAHKALRALIDGYEKGALVRGGIRAAIVGSPNVGKSTLFNLMSGFELAIVTPVPGTTRDVVRQQIQIGGVALHLADTAGLRQTEDMVENEGIIRTKAEIEAAQLVLAVFDGSRALDAPQLEFAGQCAGRAALAIVNKSDLGLAMEPAELRPFFSEVVVVSALEPGAREQVEASVKRILHLANFDPNTAMLANGRQLAAAVAASDALADSLGALESGLALDAAGTCLEDAIRALASLTGENVTQAVLDEVFSKFCVGK